MKSKRTFVFPLSITPTRRCHGAVSLACTTLVAAALAVGLAACDKRATSNPGATPAAVGSGQTSGGSNASMPSSGVEVRTPAAPDARGGGSTGGKGIAATPDTSGGPSTGSPSPGASNSGVASIQNSAPVGSAANASSANGSVAVTPPQVSTNGGASASSLGNSATTQGNTNSTPQSNTGGR